jgi:hypothetical protein
LCLQLQIKQVTFSAKKCSIVWPSAIWQPLSEHYHAFTNLDTEIVESKGKDVLHVRVISHNLPKDKLSNFPCKFMQTYQWSSTEPVMVSRFLNHKQSLCRLLFDQCWKKTCPFTTKRNLGFSKPKIWHGNTKWKSLNNPLLLSNQQVCALKKIHAHWLQRGLEGFQNLSMAWGNTQWKTIKKPLLLLLINDYVGKFYVALPNSIARKFHNNKEKIKRKEWGPIYLSIWAPCCYVQPWSTFFFLMFSFFFNNSSLFMSMSNLIWININIMDMKTTC